MSALKLFVGDRNFSSWSLRPWLFLKHHGVPFQEQVLRLYQPDTREKILEHSPTGKVPLLVHGQVRIWESLAICEYAAETFALPCAWPMSPASRAWARSVATEMHAGFSELRRELPFDCSREPLPKALGEQAAADVERVRAIWREARSRHRTQGNFLFGKFGIADAMFAPVALRFHFYDVALNGAEAEYAQTLLQHPAMQAWLKGAKAELQQASEAPQPMQAAEAPRRAAPVAPVAPVAPATAVAPEPEEDDLAEVLAIPDIVPEPEPVAAPPPAPPVAAKVVPTAAPAKPAPEPIRVTSKILPPD